MSKLILQESPFIFVCMLSYFLSAFHLLLYCFKLLQGQQKMLIMSNRLLCNDFSQSFHINYSIYWIWLLANEFKVSQIRIEVDLECFINIDFPFEIILCFVLWMTIDLYKVFLIDILFEHDFSIIQNFENHDIQRKNLIFRRIPSDHILFLWKQYSLKGFSHNTIYYFIEMFQLLHYPRLQILLLFLQLLNLFFFLELLLLLSLLWNLLINCCWSNNNFFSFEIKIIFIKGKVCWFISLLFRFWDCLSNNLFGLICLVVLYIRLYYCSCLNRRFFFLFLLWLFLQ